MERKTIVVSLMAVLFVTSVAAFGAAGDKAKVKGMIVSRTGETLIVNGPDGKVTVVLTDGTRTKDNVGLFGWGRKEMSSVVLIPGVKVSVDGVSDDQGRIAANCLSCSSSAGAIFALPTLNFTADWPLTSYSHKPQPASKDTSLR
jgi:hypothetical protein